MVKKEVNNVEIKKKGTGEKEIKEKEVGKMVKKKEDGQKEVRKEKVKKEDIDIAEGKIQFIQTYIPGFDVLLREGVPSGSAILVEGGPGNGKTIFCLNLVKNMCERGKKVLFMSFEEPEARLRTHLKIFGAKPEEYEKKGLLYIKRFNALDIARSVEALLSEAKKELLIDVQPVLIPPEFQPDIVLIDSLSSISSAFSGEGSRFRIYMEQLFRYLEGHKITSFLIREVASPTHVGNTFSEQGEAVSFLSDGIIVLYNYYCRKGVN